MLPGFERTPARRIAGVIAVLAIFASRVALLPEGPWEQDEALFAHAVLDFDIARHSPHPPGFPGWILIGKLVAPFCREPLLGLQLASAAASTALFVVLARLLARRHGAGLALGGSLLFSFAPVTWFHAARGFSTTPALACIAGALLAWREPSVNRRVWVGWALLGLAFAIRPQLLPVLALVAGTMVWRDRIRARRLPAGLGVAGLVVAVTYGWAVVETGGLARYLALALDHLERHRADIASIDATAWTDHGLVRGLGGPLPALGWGALAGVGALRLLRNGPEDRFVVALALTTGLSIQLLSHPGFPRYAVATVAATTPLVVAAVAALPRLVGVPLLAAASVGAACIAWPAVTAIHRTQIPIMKALSSLDARGMDDAPIVYSHGSFSFVRYARATGLVTRDIIDDRRRFPDPPGPYDYVGARQGKIMPGLTVDITSFADFPEPAWVLSQHRFRDAVWVRNPVWLGKGAHGLELGERGEPFVWLGRRAILHVPSRARQLVLVLELDRRMEPQTVEARVGTEEPSTWTLTQPGIARLVVPLEGCPTHCQVRLDLPRARAREGDRRLLSVRLRAAWVEGPDFPIRRRTWSPGLPGSLLASDVQLRGFHQPDVFMKRRAPGAWTRGQASVRFPASPGRLRLRVARPEHLEGPVRVRSHASEITVEPGSVPEDIWIDVAAPEGVCEIEIDAPTFVPQMRDPSSADARELGLIVLDAEFLPN